MSISRFLLQLSLLTTTAVAAPTLQEGDVVFIESTTAQSAAIRAATGSPISHVGIVLKHGDGLKVLEAARTVRFTALEAFSRRSRAGRVVIRRPKDTARVKAALPKLRAAAKTYLGGAYDAAFRWTAETMYCSELVYRIYREGAGMTVGRVQQFKDLDLKSPVVKRLIKVRRKAGLDTSEHIITPVAQSLDPQFETVHDGPL